MLVGQLFSLLAVAGDCLLVGFEVWFAVYLTLLYLGLFVRCFGWFALLVTCCAFACGYCC